jgi:hypothetical protein
MIYKNIIDFENAIYEGLIRTHNIESSIQMLKYWYESMTKYFKIELLNDDEFKIIIKDKISTSLFDILIRDINNLGYFPSLIYLENDKNMINRFKYNYDKINNIIMSKNIIGIDIICEKKFDDEVKILNKMYYHVCREQNIERIFKIGLYSKSKKRISNHPDRIYLCIDFQCCEDLIKRFRMNDLINEIPEQRYRILEIDISKLKLDFSELNKEIIFRKDPNMSKNAIYTYDNIPPKYIKINEKIKNNK